TARRKRRYIEAPAVAADLAIELSGCEFTSPREAGLDRTRRLDESNPLLERMRGARGGPDDRADCRQRCGNDCERDQHFDDREAGAPAPSLTSHCAQQPRPLPSAN